MSIKVRETAEETRERIARTAEELFRRMGFAKTAVADIASELGMSPANVYRFFPSKTAIVATSQSFMDALSVAPYAYWAHAPIFLARPGDDRLSDETLAAIREGGDWPRTLRQACSCRPPKRWRRRHA